LTGNAIFTSRTTYELMRDLLPTVTEHDVQAYARTRSADDAAVVVATTPDDTAATLPADTIVARLRAAPSRADDASLEPLDVEPLLASPRAAGRIVSEQAVPEVRAYQWTLSNGMRVLLKPTSFTFDDIQFRAVAPGGASLASDAAYPSAYLADAIIGETGVGRIPGPRLRRWLAATSISLSIGVSDDAVSVDGSVRPADLEPFLQLVHLHLTAPRRDTVAFRRYQARAASLVQDRGRDPDAVFRDSVTTAFSDGDPRAMRNGAQFYRNARLDDALAFWSDRTANGAGFTIAIVGDFTLATMRPLIERYLASIPRGTAEQPRERMRPGPRPGARDVASGTAERARTVIGFTAPVVLTAERLIALDVVRETIARAVTERLRGEMGGTYQVDVSLGVDVVPPSRYTMAIEFESAHGRIDALAAAAIGALDQLRRVGPTAAQFRAVRETRLRDFDGRLEDNGYWASELSAHARHGWSVREIAEHRDEAQAMPLEQVRRACAEYSAGAGYTRVTMRPRGTRARP
jgi:zinc protease